MTTTGIDPVPEAVNRRTGSAVPLGSTAASGEPMPVG